MKITKTFKSEEIKQFSLDYFSNCSKDIINKTLKKFEDFISSDIADKSIIDAEVVGTLITLGTLHEDLILIDEFDNKRIYLLNLEESPCKFEIGDEFITFTII